ncbi:beta-casein-like [Pteronotus mesoamericanus]|uniref:beta-casein-like n=1 Tax=Pteronotus mesoamericanus TaxID=1884717 RepID=UPI0023EDD744|nr:beta-casein-like [Pteronotus parnellii mesoamericanus]
MKVLILACLVALALAREEELSVSSMTVESLSSTDESITHINEQKPEKFESDKQQQREGKCQDKIQSLVQPQPLLYPFAEPFPYNVLPQNGLPLAQPAVVLPILQPEVIRGPNTKETIFPKRQVMPFLQSPGVSIFQHQIPNLSDVKIPQLPLPLLQPMMHQVPQPLLQAPMLPPQPLLSLPQPKALPLSQQVITHPQRDMLIQALLLCQEPLLDPTQNSNPVTQPISTVYKLQQLNHYTCALHLQKHPASDVKFYGHPQGKKVSNAKSESQLCNLTAKYMINVPLLHITDNLHQSNRSQYQSQNELGYLLLASTVPKPKTNRKL